MTPSLEQSYREIPLTQGQIAIVDASDYECLSQWKWFAKWDDHTQSYYACRKALRVSGRPCMMVMMHRQILDLEYGDKRNADHKNGDTLFNSRENLRIASRTENARNARTRKDNTSGFKGVNRHYNTWRYRIRTDTGRETVGGFISAKAAFVARCARVSEAHGEFARLA